jgi:membrane fusion protein (multidrug efflux system)
MPQSRACVIVVVLLLVAITGALAYKKTLQIQEQIAQGSQLPPPISVTVAQARPDTWNRRVRAVGTLVAFQGVDITTEESGIVTAINFESGEEVEAGSLLIDFDNRTELANLESARAQFEADNSQYQRLLKLRDQSFVTKNDIDTQASLVDIAEARINVAKTALSKKRIYAPFSGRLGIRQVDLGEYVAPGGVIVTLLSLDRLYLDFTLPESNFRDLVRDQLIEFKVRSYPEQTFSARVETWNPQLDANTRNITIRAIVDNRERLLDPDPDYRLAARQVEVAYRAEGIAGISSGIEAGDMVVTSGQLKLYPNLRVAIVDDVPEYQSSAQ